MSKKYFEYVSDRFEGDHCTKLSINTPFIAWKLAAEKPYNKMFHKSKYGTGLWPQKRSKDLRLLPLATRRACRGPRSTSRSINSAKVLISFLRPPISRIKHTGLHTKPSSHSPGFCTARPQLRTTTTTNTLRRLATMTVEGKRSLIRSLVF